MTFPSGLGPILTIILFVMPGFIINKVISLILPSLEKEKSDGSLILQGVIFSCVNYAVFSWVIVLLYENQSFWWLLAVVVLLLGPIVIGFVAARIIKKTSLNVTLTASAWDYYFGQEKPAWVLFTLKDDSRIGGFFSDKSCSSTGGIDIYLEEVWRLDNDGKFIEKISDTDGCIIKNSDIKYMEFFKLVPKGGNSNE